MINSEGTSKRKKEKTRIIQQGIDKPHTTRIGMPCFSNFHCQEMNPGLLPKQK